MSKKLTQEDFIQRSKLIHNNRYDYSKVTYINGKSKVLLVCDIHGQYEQKAETHLSGGGCRKCQYQTLSKKFNNGIVKFINKSMMIHGDIYDYSKVEYKNNRTKVTISCKIHGDFDMIPINHTRGQGCKICGQIVTNNKNKKSQDEYIVEANRIHNFKYNYSKTEYDGINSTIIIDCKKHGEFNISAANHIHSKSGCPKCNMSKGEQAVENWLLDNGLVYEKQKTFDKCLFKSKLKFDFYVPSLNLLIEFDGVQHFKPIDFFGGATAFNELQHKDLIKNTFAYDNNITLIRLSNITLIDSILNEYRMSYRA